MLEKVYFVTRTRAEGAAAAKQHHSNYICLWRRRNSQRHYNSIFISKLKIQNTEAENNNSGQWQNQALKELQPKQEIRCKNKNKKLACRRAKTLSSLNDPTFGGLCEDTDKALLLPSNTNKPSSNQHETKQDKISTIYFLLIAKLMKSFF